MGQETLDELDLRRRPAIGVKRVVDGPYDACAAGSVQTDVEALLGARAGQKLVVGRGGLQLLVGVQASEGEKLAVRRSQETRDTFISGVVGAEVVALALRERPPAPEAPHVVDLDLVGGSRAKRQAVALGADRVVDEAGGRRPAGVIERGFVQRCQDAIERVSLAHALPPQLQTWPT